MLNIKMLSLESQHVLQNCVLFCYITNHLTVPWGTIESQISNLNVSLDSSRETLKFPL